jgi:DNA-binding PadR family transcriptional regulator
MPRESLGDVEHLVLVALLHLNGESYAVPIMREIADRAGRDVARPAVYIALTRLEAKGFLQSRVGESSPDRGGRPRRYFKMTRAGARQLRESRDALVRMWQDADPLLRKAVR